MHTTPVSLLDRLRSDPDDHSWRQFVHLYTPMLFFWARRAGVSEHEAADITQEVFLTLLQSLPSFDRDRGRFRSWLQTIAMNKLISHRRRDRRAAHQPIGAEDDVAGPDGAEEFWEREYQKELTAQALLVMRRDFSETTWQACWLFVAEGLSAGEVAGRLGISTNAVYLAKSHVIRRLRQELRGLVD